MFKVGIRWHEGKTAGGSWEEIGEQRVLRAC